MALSQTSVMRLYNTVIEDVISGVREAFLDEGVDEQVLQELKQIWETKLMSSKAVEPNLDPPEPQPPQMSNSVKTYSSNKGGSKRNSNANSNAHSGAQQQAQAKEPTLPQPQIQQPQPQPTHVQPQQIQPQIPHQPQQPQPQQMQQVQHVQHMQSIPMQQQQVQQPVQQHQPIPQQQQVISQPAPAIEKQVSIQIKLPVHQNLPERLVTVHVPASAIQGNQLHAIFTGPIITTAISLPVHIATSLLQQHVNQTFEGLPGFTPVPVAHPVQLVSQGANSIMQQQLIQGQTQGNIAQLDGAIGDPSDDDDDDDDDDDNDDDDKEKEVSIQIKLPAHKNLPKRLVTLRVPASAIQQQGNIAQLDGAVGDSSDDDDDEEEEENDDDEDLDEEKEEEEQEDAGAREEEPLCSEDDVTDDDPTDLFDTDNVVVCQYDKITRSRNKWKFYLKDGIMNLSGKDFVFQKANGDAEW